MAPRQAPLRTRDAARRVPTEKGRRSLEDCRYGSAERCSHLEHQGHLSSAQARFGARWTAYSARTAGPRALPKKTAHRNRTREPSRSREGGTQPRPLTARRWPGDRGGRQVAGRRVGCAPAGGRRAGGDPGGGDDGGALGAPPRHASRRPVDGRICFRAHSSHTVALFTLCVCPVVPGRVSNINIRTSQPWRFFR